jgi:uncharacterized membrane protein
MTLDPARREEVESRWEATPVVVAVIVLQAVLAIVSARSRPEWTLAGLDWWVWLVPVVPELLLLVPLALSKRRMHVIQEGERRSLALELLAIVGVLNTALLIALIVSLVQGNEKSGGELLLKAGAVWSTNVVAFGLWYWALDRGGPARRLMPNPPAPDFQFPQMENPALAEPGWHPRLVDYLYVSFTNAIAFSPTDAMPLRRRVKLLMMGESAISALTVLLVAARAVNIIL